MTIKLNLGESFSLPLEAVTEKLAFLGRTGSGKTYGAQKLAEEMDRIHAQFIALDPVGKWWSLRLSADGKTPAIAVPVFGGLHGDIPLEPTAGKLIADVIVDRAISAIVDVSQFESDGQKARFMTDFGNRFFFRKKAAPSAVHLFIEEAQEFVPQNPERDEKFMLHAWTRIQKLGRNFGIGSSLISQRPQEVNKKCLNLTEVLFVFQLTGPHERKTVAWWIEEKGIDEDIAAELPKLQRGCPHVWSPGWLQISKVIRIGLKETYDASRTPKVGSRQEVRDLAPIDLARLQKDMATTIERAKQEDPRELRRQVADLRAEVARLQTAQPAPQIESVEVPMVKQQDLSRLETAVTRLDALRDRMAQQQQVVVTEVGMLTEALRKVNDHHQRVVGPAIPSGSLPLSILGAGPLPASKHIQGIRALQERGRSPQSALNGPQQRILDAIAWVESLGQPDADQAAVAFLAGYTVGGGAFNNPRGALHTAGLIEYRSGRLALTTAGRTLARPPDMPLHTDELHARVLERLPGPERKILRALLEVYPKALSHADLAERSGYSDGGGAFNNPRGRLRSLGLIEYPTKGMAAARSLLFLEHGR